jgi:hypothetical protein
MEGQRPENKRNAGAKPQETVASCAADYYRSAHCVELVTLTGTPTCFD